MRIDVLGLSAVFCLVAQLDRGTLTVTVSNPTGAVIPNAKITFIQQGTQAATSTLTNDASQNWGLI